MASSTFRMMPVASKAIAEFAKEIISSHFLLDMKIG
jgi:hypothetical protein